MPNERLDSIKQIANFLGVSISYFYKKVKPKLEESGVLFTRPGPYGRRIYYTYKRLLLAWQIEVKDI